MLISYFRTAWRHLIKNKVYSITNLAGLSIGLACVMLIMLYVSDEVSFDRFHEKGDRIYRIVHDAMGPEGKEEKGGNTGGPQARAFQEGIPEIESACRVRGNWELMVQKGNDAISERVLYADSNFFHLFTFPLLEGNPAVVLKDPSSLVISEDIARKYFNSVHVIGKTMEINEDGKFSTFIITGVARNSPLNSSIRFDLLMPIEATLNGDWTKIWTNTFLNTFVVLKPMADKAAVERKMAVLFKGHEGKYFENFKKEHPNFYYRYKLQPYLSIHLEKEYNAGNGINAWSDASYSYILGGIALFILVIACINFINLTLGRSLRRGKEIGIRKVTGGTRSQLIIQFMGESLLLNILAFIPALVMVQLCLPWFSELAGKHLSAAYLFKGQTVLLFALLVFVNTGLSGFYPSLVLSGFSPIQTLYGRFRITGKNYLGKSLVVIQFAMAVFLIIGTVVMQRQFHFMVTGDAGFKTANMIDVQLPAGDVLKVNSFRSELTRLPFIEQVGAQSNDLINTSSTHVVVGQKELYNVSFLKMDERMLPMLEIPFVMGHNFAGVPSDSLSCIVNQSMVEAAGWKTPIGQRIVWDDRYLSVIGVVKDFHSASMKNKITPFFIHLSPSSDFYELVVKIDGRERLAAVQAIARIYKQLYPYTPFNYSFLDDMLADQYKADKRWKTIITIAAVLSIFISCLGLFGLATLSIEQRTREIGVRKVLGASALNITRLLSGDFLKLVLLSILVASPAAWYFSNQWLQDYAYRIRIGWWIFALAGTLVVLISLITLSFQSVRAAMANPARSLRSE
jgi:putative ABC transport system permease protein